MLHSMHLACYFVRQDTGVPGARQGVCRNELDLPGFIEKRGQRTMSMLNPAEEQSLRKSTQQIVTDMVAAGVAEKRLYQDERCGREYYNLITPGAFEKQLVFICALGYPEQVGVWSYTLLHHARIRASSMEPYFAEFAQHDIGLVAINPNCFVPDMEGQSFVY